MPSITITADTHLGWPSLSPLLEAAGHALGGADRCCVHGSAAEGWTVERMPETDWPAPALTTIPPPPWLVVDTAGTGEDGRPAVVLLGTQEAVGACSRLLGQRVRLISEQQLRAIDEGRRQS